VTDAVAHGQITCEGVTAGQRADGGPRLPDAAPADAAPVDAAPPLDAGPLDCETACTRAVACGCVPLNGSCADESTCFSICGAGGNLRQPRCAAAFQACDSIDIALCLNDGGPSTNCACGYLSCDRECAGIDGCRQSCFESWCSSPLQCAACIDPEALQVCGFGDAGVPPP
jgi:hypothetical protein